MRSGSETTSSPIRILRILTRLNIGGPAIHAAILSTKLDPQRFSTFLVVGQPDAAEGDLSALAQQDGATLIQVKTLRRSINPWADLVTFIRLLRIVWQTHPPIIHTHMAKAGALGRLAGVFYNTLGAGRRPGRKVILIHTFHGHVLDGYFSPGLSRIFVRIERWLARRTDCLIAVSHTIQQELLELGIGRRDQWQVIPLGLELSTLASLPLPNGSSPVRFGMVGRLVPIKNHALFLEGLHRVRRQEPSTPVSGVIVGDGPLRRTLERACERLGLDRLVRFTGWQRDLRSVYGSIEVVCVTSWNEGTPAALIEAMAAGLAVVATDVGGVRDVVDGEHNSPALIAPGEFRLTERGVLVRPGDVEGLTKAMVAVATDVALRRRLGAAARAYAVPRFTHERLLRDMAALYERALHSRIEG